MAMGFAAMSGKLPPIDDPAATNILNLLCAKGLEAISRIREPIGTTPLPRSTLRQARLSEEEADARRAETLAMMAEVDSDSTAHELRACGGDCPDCQRERAEQREEN